MTSFIKESRNAVTIGLAFLTGLGFTLMMIALGGGAIAGEAANGDAVGLAFVVGLAMFAGGLISWLAVAQPHKNFDDINQPMYHGHDHDEEASHDE